MQLRTTKTPLICVIIIEKLRYTSSARCNINRLVKVLVVVPASSEHPIILRVSTTTTTTSSAKHAIATASTPTSGIFSKTRHSIYFHSPPLTLLDLQRDVEIAILSFPT